METPQLRTEPQVQRQEFPHALGCVLTGGELWRLARGIASPETVEKARQLLEIDDLIRQAEEEAELL